MLKVLVPVDGSALALDGVRHVMRLVHHGLRAEVVLAHAEPQANLYELVTARDPAVIEGAAQLAGHDALREAERLLGALAIPFVREVVVGDPARVLVEIAESSACDLIVMGAAETSDAHSALFGSVSHAVLNRAKIPVTLVRRPVPRTP